MLEETHISALSILHNLSYKATIKLLETPKPKLWLPCPQAQQPTNAYRVFFFQSSSIDHEAIALVTAENKDQGAGRFYHVTETVGLGMDYDLKPTYRFDKIPE